MLIFPAWHISTIMHCQILLNMSGVTPRPVFSIFRFALPHKLSHCRMPLAHQSRQPPPTPDPSYNPTPPHPTPTLFFHLSAYLNMRWRLNGFQKISFWENKAWKSWIFYLGIFSAFPLANGLDSNFRLFQDWISYFNLHLIILEQRGRLYELTGIFLSKYLNIPLKVPWLEMKRSNICYSLTRRTNTHRRYQGLTITA